MKVVMDLQDKDYIERINHMLQGEEDLPLLLTEKNKKYYIEFECDDLAKANAFISNLVFQIEEHTQDTGITATALKYSIISRQEVEGILQEAMRKINDLWRY